jgi:outer membrane protein
MGQKSQGETMRFLSLLCCFLIASFASAKDLKIGTVDLQKLFKAYPGYKTAEKKLKALASKKQKELSEPEGELTDLQKELEGSGSVLSSKEKKKKATQYQEKLKDYTILQKQMQMELAAKQDEMVAGILDEVKGIVADVAKDKGVDLVLDAEKTVYVNGGVDLTDAVLKTKNYKSSDSDSSDEGSSKKK